MYSKISSSICFFVISSIGDAEPMLKSHLSIAINLGVFPEQLKEFLVVIKPFIGAKKTKAHSLFTVNYFVILDFIRKDICVKD